MFLPRLDSDVVLYRVELQKQRESDEFGFSISESSIGSGVYIKTIQKGSPADMSKAIKKSDRILQVCTDDRSIYLLQNKIKQQESDTLQRIILTKMI